MIFPLILGIVLGAVTVIFALQNITVITVSFFSWQIEGSLALILLMAVFTGILISLLIVLPESIRSYFRYKNLTKENKRLEEELRKQKELTVFARNIPASSEAIAKIEKGAIADPHAL
jgi:uncharacterized integral membrane protein